MSSGIKANFGTDCKPWHGGHAARCGLEAAQLAAAGFTGNPSVLEHGDGFGSTHGAGMKPDWEFTIAGLGAPHEVADPGIGVKRFPACASTHQSLDAVLALAQEHALDASAVAGVECAVSYMAPHQLIYERAETGLQGKFSIPYCVAVALLDRTVGLAQFADERVRRADVQALMPKVRMIVHPPEELLRCLGRTLFANQLQRVKRVVFAELFPQTLRQIGHRHPTRDTETILSSERPLFAPRVFTFRSRWRSG